MARRRGVRGIGRLRRIPTGEVFFAHSGDQPDRSDWQGLAEHLTSVAALAARNAARFGAGEWGNAAGLLHDLGKYSAAFQRRVAGGARVDHATAGAQEALRRWGRSATPLQYVVAGHHAGLADAGGESRAGRSTLADRLQASIEPCDAFAGEIALPDALPPPPLRLTRSHPGFQLAFFTRMLFGALIDADYRDTEAFYDRLEGRKRFVDD